MKRKLILIFATVLVALGLTGCSATEKVGELAKKSYAVVERTLEVLVIVEDEIVGSPLEERIGKDIDSVQKALESLKGTLEMVMDFSGVEYDAVVASSNPIGDLERAIAELDEAKIANKP